MVSNEIHTRFCYDIKVNNKITPFNGLPNTLTAVPHHPFISVPMQKLSWIILNKEMDQYIIIKPFAIYSVLPVLHESLFHDSGIARMGLGPQILFVYRHFE